MGVHLLLLAAVALTTVAASPCNNADDGPCVSGLSPTKGSVNGATRITMTGFGFIEDLYTQTMEVYLASDTQQVNCTIHEDGCTETQIMCYTEPLAAGEYYVRVVLNGASVPMEAHCNDENARGDACKFEASWDHTPTITSFPVKSTTPGEALQVEGKILTSLYGTHEEASTNGRLVRFTRVWTNSGKCDLMDENAEFFELALDGEEGEEDTGRFTCMPTGSYVGNQNLTYIINGTFGRSKAEKSLMNVMANNDLAMFQTYAEVTSVSHSTGSTEGGVPLTISGDFFDNTRGEPQVTIGGVACEDVELSSDYSTIECTIPEEPSEAAMSGNRGILLSFWNISIDSGDTDDVMREYTSPDSEENLDTFYFEYDLALDYSVAILKGYFVAPSTNTYKILLRADDSAVLYYNANGNANASAELLRVDSNNLNGGAVESDIISFDQGQEVYLEVLVRNAGGSMGAELSVHMYDTVYTNSHSGQALNEMHVIETSSNTVDEIQSLTFNSWTSSENIQEEHQSYEINVESDPSYCFYRIGLFGVYTTRVAVNAPALEIKTALMNLPFITNAESVLDPVIEELTVTSWKFTIKFKYLGAYPVLSLREVSLVGVDCSMTLSQPVQDQAGLPTGHHVVPFFDGVPGEPIAAADISASSLSSSLQKLFSVQCPSAILSPVGARYTQDFEDNAATETEPFCGRSAATGASIELYNAGRDDDRQWLRGIPGTFKELCFAYQGHVGNYFLVWYEVDDQARARWISYEFTSELASTYPDVFYTTWNFVCLDLFELIMEQDDSVTSTASFSTLYVRLHSEDSTGEYPMMVDTVSFTQDGVTDDPTGVVLYERLRMRNWIAESISVAAGSEADSYDVTIRTLECAHDLPLISFNFAGAGAYASADSATWSFQDGASVQVTRTSAASPPVTGTVVIRSGSSQLGFNAFSTEGDELANYIAALGPDVGLVTVEREGDCRGYTWTVEYTTVAGDHVDLEESGSSLQGDNPVLTLTKIQDGGVHWRPVPGDLLRTSHDNPQVVVAINSIPSKCATDCVFTWDEAQTPTLASISPANGGYGDSVTITGTGFSTTDAENIVMIGRATCDVTASTANQLTCTVGEGTPGARTVGVTVTTKGAARSDSLVQFTYEFSADSVSPSTGYSSGGAVVTVSGSGFGDEVEVTIGGSACDIVDSSYTEVVCIAPSGTAGSQAVVVSENGATASGSLTFTFTSAPGQITGISASTAHVGGGTEVTISGSNLGDAEFSDDAVLVATTAAQIDSYTSTEVVVTLPVMEKGTYTLNIKLADDGYAERSVDTSIEYILRVDNVFPRQGSLMGGQKLTITGQGFSTSGGNDVTVGDALCFEESATDSQIVCQLEYTTTVHSVTNQGTHATYGTGYAWSPNYLNVELGDFIEFSWSTPDTVEGVGYRVVQVSSPSSTMPSSGGFKSSDIQTANGVYKYQFTSTGTFYFYSGVVTPSSGVAMWGTVVVSDKPNYARYVTLNVGDVEADYDTASAVSDPSDSSDCSPLLTVPIGCDEVMGSDSDLFDLGMWNCMMPTISAISPSRVLANQPITITGTGFSTTDCQNEVILEPGVLDVTCVVSSASSTQIVCSIPPSCDGLPTDVPLSLQVRVNNYGYALDTQVAKTARGVTIGSAVTSVTPGTGSAQGGQVITITGTNLCYQCGESCGSRRRRSNLLDHETLDGGNTAHSATAVNLCANIISESAEEIRCETRSAPGNQIVEVQTQSQDGAVSVSECDGACDVIFSNDYTPTVTSIAPAPITANNQILTITGTRFGNDLDAVTVLLGTSTCSVTSVTSTSILCDVGTPLGGAQYLHVVIDGLGVAELSVATIDVTRSVTSVTPSNFGTTGGALVTISGVGFAEDDLSIAVGDTACSNTSFVSSGELVCVAPTLSAGTYDVVVTSGGVAVTYSSVVIDSSSQPTITSVSPSNDVGGASVDVSGTNLFSPVQVLIDGTECEVTSYSGDGTSVSCTLGAHAAGTYSLDVTVTSYGLATGSVDFTYDLAINSLSPTSGSFGGGQTVTINGRGFSADDVSVQICSEDASVDVDASSSTQLVITTPSNSGSGSAVCDVTVTDDVSDVSATSSGAYTYSGGADVTGVNPVRGGTGGGTTVTISGSGFGTDNSAVDVTIGGSECVLSTVADTEIVCVTEPRDGSIQTQVQVHLGDTGIARQTSADYEYIDVWSSVYTWGGESLPAEGDLIVIPEGMTVLFDTVTPIMKLLLINGGSVIFENTPSADVHLNAEIIFIANGGTFQVGTEEEPYQGNAVIELHGHVMDRELPIYGTKVLAVRQGTLDLHGARTIRPWTRLDGTVQAGANQITVEQDIDWQAGDKIVIATTGDRHSQRENEEHTIASVSGRTLTLEGTLAFKHLGEDIDFQGQVTLEARAEVGLLSRNVRFIGSNDAQWNDNVEACEDGFDTGEFATQTCFQGRFGEEVGTSEFGAMILMHAPVADQHDLVARIENVELNFVGQAFRLGRYAIHFHLLGDMSGSYVRSCSIHKSFNRAVNVHATNYVLIEHNVGYNIMGGAFFLEDGVEVGNVFQYNLAVFVKSSTSLQNDDITPAAYWITNANNTYQHNVAAGGTHFGFWYRMHEHPDGPSFAAFPNFCPQKSPQATWYNNTVHSQGWFGIWIFQVWTPVEGGCCECTTPQAGVFDTLIAYNCEKGAEWVGGGSVQWINFRLFNNEKAGIEMKMILQPAWPYDEDHGAVIAGGYIVGNDPSGVLYNSGTKSGIIVPYDRGLILRDIHFINFVGNQACYGVTQIDGTTEANNGGYTYRLSGHQFTNVDNKIGFRWEHEAQYMSTDNSLTGTNGDRIVACTDFLPDSCVRDTGSEFTSGAVDGCVCPASQEFHRFSFNNYSPASLEGKDVAFITDYGTSVALFKKKRRTHPFGWMALLPSKHSIQMQWVDAEQLVNISYSGKLYDFEADDYVLMTYEFYQEPDAVNVIPGGDPELSNSSEPVTFANNMHGDWFVDSFDPQGLTNNTASVLTLLSGIGRDEENDTANFHDREVTLNVYRCYYENCMVPPDPETLPPSDTRPAEAVYWSDPATWGLDEEGNIVGAASHDESRRRRRDADHTPGENAHITIEEGSWVVLDMEDLPRFGRVWVFGVLEFKWEDDLDYVLSATHIFISGGRLIVGWEENPITGSATIELRGDWFTDDIMINSAPNIGSKVIAAFGGLDMHGQSRNVSWTELASTAQPGDTSITVITNTLWQVGDEIVIATTSYNPLESEQRTLTAVSENGMTLSFELPLENTHTGTVEDIGNGESFRLAAEVGLLSRNVRITGIDYQDGRMFEQGFGGRVLVSTYAVSDGYRTGYARFNNVEFHRMGQEGWSDFFDPRYSLAFVDTGDVSDSKPSYVTNCAFHDNYNSAFGAFGANGLLVESNVFYKTVGTSFRMWDQDHVVRNNLLVEMHYSGTWNGRQETRYTWYAMMEITNSIGMTLENNHLAGGERGGYWVDGEVCGEESLWSNNVVHSALIGVLQLPGDGIEPCTYLNGFATWRSYDFGIYSQVAGNLEINDHVSIDDLLGVHPMVVTPDPTSHQYANKYVSITNSHYVGFSSEADCRGGIVEKEDAFFRTKTLKFSKFGRGSFDKLRVRGGIQTPCFSGGDNAAPGMPLFGLTKYNAIRGKMTVSSTVIKNYDMHCVSESQVRAFGFLGQIVNDDNIHPIYTSDMTVEDVAEGSLVHIPVPSVGKINPADCVDMDCDGLKKAFITDKDGTMLGVRGTIFSNSEFAWDTDPRRGTGDYRIPYTMQTRPDGSRINLDTSADYVGRGIARDSSVCEYRNSYNAHVCEGGHVYHMMMVESMDEDTETRRVSPLGLMNMDSEERYIDLINGPQDHGWCMGYTCQKRLSLFPVVVVANQTYQMHFTGTTPQHLRLHWLNPEESSSGDAVVVGIYYSNPFRLDIMVDGVYRRPENAYDDPTTGDLRFSPGDYSIDPVTASAGDNWFDKEWNTQWITMKGEALIDITTTPLVFVSFDMPFMTVDEFFGPNLISNMAAFFDIPADKIKVATAVREDSRRRRTDVIEVTIEISNPPHDLGVTDPSDLTTEELQSIASDVIATYQLGELDDVLEVTILALSVTEPVPEVGSEEWQYIVELQTSTEVSVQVPDTVTLERAPVPVHEGAPFRVQPALRTHDTAGDAVTTLGSLTEPWEMTAYLFHVNTLYSEAELVGEMTVSSQQGWFNFSDLAVSHAGMYEIQFMVTSPEGASHLRVTSETFNVDNRDVAAIVTDAPNSTVVGESFDITVGLADSYTRQLLDDIAWRGHSWQVTVDLYSALRHPGALALTSTTADLNAGTGTATFSDLSISAHGRYFLQFRFVSSPAEYDIIAPSSAYIDVFPAGYQAPSSDRFDRMTIRFDASYAQVAYGYEDYFAAAVYNELFDRFSDRASFDDFDVYEGSIMVEFDVSGSEEDLDEVVAAIAELVADGLTVTFNTEDVSTTSSVWVNGEEYDTGSDEDSSEDNGELETWAIVLIVIAVIALVGVAVAFLVYCIYSKKRLESQTKMLEAKAAKKRATRAQRQKSLVLDDVMHGDYYQDGSSVGASTASLQSSTAGDEALIIPRAAPLASSYLKPGRTEHFDHVQVRPVSSYEPPNRLPSLGSAKPKTPVVSTTNLQLEDEHMRAPGTPEYGTRRG